jgi:hypothetical protein
VFYPAAFVTGLIVLASLYRDYFVHTNPGLSVRTLLVCTLLMIVLSVGLLADLIEKRSRL